MQVAVDLFLVLCPSGNLFFYGYAGEDGCGYPEDWPKNSWEKRGVAWNEDECETIHRLVAKSPARY